MSIVVSSEEVANVIKAYCNSNDGDEATQCLIVAIGASLLEISQDKMLEMIGEYGYD